MKINEIENYDLLIPVEITTMNRLVDCYDLIQRVINNPMLCIEVKQQEKLEQIRKLIDEVQTWYFEIVVLQKFPINETNKNALYIEIPYQLRKGMPSISLSING